MPRGRAAGAADGGGDLARTDRRALGAPDGLAAADEFPADARRWSSAMDAVREVCSAALSLRKAKGLRVRLPLATLTVATAGAAALRAVRRPRRRRGQRQGRRASPTTSPAHCEQVLTVVPRALGPRVGGQVQQVIKAVKAGDWTLVDGAAGRRRRDAAPRASTSCAWSPRTRSTPRRCPAARAWSCSTPR